jgi:predicted dehydrogenase
MNIVLFGLGSIGDRYARILKNNYPDLTLHAFRSSESAAPNPFGIHEFFSWDDVASAQPSLAIIANPTFLHVETALRCASLGMHLLIEKPIGVDTKGLEKLNREVENRRLTAYVAYCLRFHPVIIEFQKQLGNAVVYHANVRCTSYLPHWRRGRNHLETYSAFREKGGGVILELSHEFDYIEYLFGTIHNITGYAGKKGRVTIDAEDWADALIEHEAGLVTNLHINFLSWEGQRLIEADTSDGFFRADLTHGTLERVRGLQREKFHIPVESDEMYRSQLGYFLNHLGKETPMNNLREASVLFKKMIKFRKKVLNLP